MTEFIQRGIAERKLGLALHYPLIHAAVVGMAAKRTFEFGAGGSTRVFLDAHAISTKKDEHSLLDHYSCSTESRPEIHERYQMDDDGGRRLMLGRWHHCKGESRLLWGTTWGADDLDIVLHDGSHTADVVAADVAWVWPKIRPFGLLLVHDTQHSHCGQEVRSGVRTALSLVEASFSETTLPYGFGLTIVRKEGGQGEGVRPIRPKIDGEHDNLLAPVHVLGDW